jgi:hypothetical protein
MSNIRERLEVPFGRGLQRLISSIEDSSVAKSFRVTIPASAAFDRRISFRFPPFLPLALDPAEEEIDVVGDLARNDKVLHPLR